MIHGFSIVWNNLLNEFEEEDMVFYTGGWNNIENWGEISPKIGKIIKNIFGEEIKQLGDDWFLIRNVDKKKVFLGKRFENFVRVMEIPDAFVFINVFGYMMMRERYYDNWFRYRYCDVCENGVWKRTWERFEGGDANE